MKNANIKGNVAIFSVFFVSLSLTLGIYFFALKSLTPQKVRASSLLNASATLANPRLSYRALTTAGSSGTSSVTISSSNTYPDYNTNHLFPGDSVCFTNQYPAGCIGNVSYTVATVSGAQTFTVSSPLTSGIDTSGYVISTQSGELSMTFTLVNTIPSGGTINIGIPVAANGNNDGIPDTGTSLTASGFDFNRLTPTSVNVTQTGGTCTGGWNTPVVASTSGTITITKATSSCAGATITVKVPNLVNPAPITGSSPGHTQGTADYYKIAIITKDGAGGILDLTNVIVAPVEGVLVSATVDQSLSFVVTGVASGQSVCGATTSVTTTATAVPWGTIAQANAFKNAAQLLEVSTNASGGYSVKIEENDQMGLNGNTCTGVTPGSDGFTFGSGKCIRDTVCDSACTESTSSEWVTATNNGLGYSLANVTGKGTDAVFLYNESSRTFSAKQIADYTEGAETKQSIMSNAGPVSGNQINVCYRISVSGTQPAGYYYNKVKYTATPIF